MPMHLFHHYFYGGVRSSDLTKAFGLVPLGIQGARRYCFLQLDPIDLPSLRTVGMKVRWGEAIHQPRSILKS